MALEFIGLFISIIFLVLFWGLIFISLPIASFLKEKVNKQIETHKNTKRTIDLRTAKIFLRRYEDKFGKQTLGNKYCSVEFIPNERNDSPNILTITDKHFFRETTFYLYKSTDISSSGIDVEAFKKHLDMQPVTIKQMQNYWAKMCNKFSYNTKYGNIFTFTAQAFEYNIKTSKTSPITGILININECSAAEMLSIPGMTIAKAQKVIKKRETTIGYYSISDFLKTANISEEYHQKIFNMRWPGSSTTLLIKINKQEGEK